MFNKANYQNYIRIIPRNNQTYEPPRYRHDWVDYLRAITLISMIAYHTMWDLVNIYGLDAPWYNRAPGYIWQQSICWSFIIISGFCVGLGNNFLKRGIIVFLCGGLTTAITCLGFPQLAIRFGVLTFLGTAMLFTGMLKPVLIKVPPALGIVLAGILFFITRNVNMGYLGFEGIRLAALPEALYSGYITAFFGFPFPGFYSTDYFSFLPWIFLFLIGFFLYGTYDYYKGEEHGKVFIAPLSFVGRHSLIIYMLHQPVIYFVLYLLYR